MIKFISYTGKYPNLCRGILTLEINGKIYKFGHNYSDAHYDDTGVFRFYGEDPDNPNLPEFWTSGGECGFIGHFEDTYVHEDPWKIQDYDVDKLPPELRPLKDDIMRVFNDNVPYGCCGGCL